MWFFRKTAEFLCPKCYATGRLPVVEGDAYCPKCGERVWTVRRPLHPEEPEGRITPDYRLPIRAHYLPLRLRGRWLSRLCVRLFPSRVSRWLARREERARAHISELFRQLQTCRSRAEYEKVLGRPVCIISGKGCGTIGPGGGVLNEPDLIEHYECGDCCIGLSFKDDKVQEFCGSIRLTPLYVEFRKPEKIDWERP